MVNYRKFYKPSSDKDPRIPKYLIYTKRFERRQYVCYSKFFDANKAKRESHE